MMNGLAVGRDVHFVLPSGEHRAAKVVRIFDLMPTSDGPQGLCNLCVFLDGANDTGQPYNATDAWFMGVGTIMPMTLWVTSVHYDGDKKAIRTWHWPERVPPETLEPSATGDQAP